MKRNEYIVKQPYIKVVREVGSVGKTEYREDRDMYLYEDRLVTAYHTFSLEKVMDLSFKDIHGKGGILFVHTNHGVYSYTIETAPDTLLHVFKRLKNVKES